MFDFSFVQTCMVITATAVLLGRHETLTAAKYIGKTCGRIIGTMKGYRAKYENSVKDGNSDLFELQTNVRKELNELSGVAHDINMISSTSNRLSFSTANSALNRQYDHPNMGYQHHQPSSGIGNSVMPNINDNSIAHLNSAAPPVKYENLNQIQEQNTLKLTKLILAEEELRKTNGNASKVDTYGVGSGADIISTCISESIMNDSYRIATQKK